MPCAAIETSLIRSRANLATPWAANCTTLIFADPSAGAFCGICLWRTLRNPAKRGKHAGRLFAECASGGKSRVLRHRDFTAKHLLNSFLDLSAQKALFNKTLLA